MAIIFGTSGNDLLVGTPDSDTLWGRAGQDTLQGGDGNDWLWGWAELNPGNVGDVLDGGNGDDIFQVDVSGVSHRLTGGAGADLFEFEVLRSKAPLSGALVAMTVTDFSAAEGDRIDLDYKGDNQADWVGVYGLVFEGEAPAGFNASSGNAAPVGTAAADQTPVWVLPSATQTLLYVDANRNAMVDSFDLVAVFDGLPTLGRGDFQARFTLTGTDSADSLQGTAFGDYLVARGGDDLLHGLDGSDVLHGEAGNDTLMGDAGDDTLWADDGSDLLLGGDGNDKLLTGNGPVTMDGGAGDDAFAFLGSAAGTTPVASGGAGSDLFVPLQAGATGRVTDFQAGAGGDTIDPLDLLGNNPPVDNPFDPAQGFLRLRVDGTDTLLEWDADGAAGNDHSWRTVLELTGVDGYAMTPANFFAMPAITSLTVVPTPNTAPVAANDSAATARSTAVLIDVLANDSDADAGQVLAVASFTQPAVGSVSLDAATGRLLYQPLANWNGSTSFGYTVSDGHGGSASATVSVTVNASLTGTDAAETLNGTASADSVQARGGNDVVNAGDGDDFIAAGAGNDRVNGGNGNDTEIGGDGADQLVGNAGADTLAGGAGNDLLFGGNATTRGDGFADLFVFNTAPDSSSNHDTVYGFEANARDKLVLSLQVFAALAGGASTGVDVSELRLGTQALDADDWLLFDSASARLYYDADANGPGAPVWVASLPALTGTLDASDFGTQLPPGL